MPPKPRIPVLRQRKPTNKDLKGSINELAAKLGVKVIVTTGKEAPGKVKFRRPDLIAKLEELQQMQDRIAELEGTEIRAPAELPEQPSRDVIINIPPEEPPSRVEPPSRDEMSVGPGEEVFINIPPEPQVETKPKEELTTHEVEKIVEREGHTRQQLDDQTGKIGEGARIHGRYTPAMIYHHQMRKQMAQWNRHNLFYPYQNTVMNHGKRFLMLNRTAHYE